MSLSKVLVATAAAATLGLATLSPAQAFRTGGGGGGWHGGGGGWHGGGYGGGWHGGYGGWRGGGWGYGLGAGLLAGAVVAGAATNWGYGYGYPGYSYGGYYDGGYYGCRPVYNAWGAYVGRRCY